MRENHINPDTNKLEIPFNPINANILVRLYNIICTFIIITIQINSSYIFERVQMKHFTNCAASVWPFILSSILFMWTGDSVSRQLFSIPDRQKDVYGGQHTEKRQRSNEEHILRSRGHGERSDCGRTRFCNPNFFFLSAEVDGKILLPFISWLIA